MGSQPTYKANLRERVYGPELMRSVFAFKATVERTFPIYLYGGNTGTASQNLLKTEF